jgi:hypothetical protein
MQALRVVGIVLLSLFVVATCAVFALLTICGAWKDDKLVPYMFLCLVLIAAAIFGIARLGRAIHRSKHATDAVVSAEAAAQVAVDPLQEANALTTLRIAVGVRVGLAVATLVLQHMRAGNTYPTRYLPVALFTVLFYQLPNAWVLWRIRERSDRWATVFALCYAAVGAVWSLFYLGPMLRYAAAQPGNFLPVFGVGIAAEIFIVVAAIPARAVLPKMDDSVHWIIGIMVSLALSGLGHLLTTMLQQWVYR